MYTATDIRNVEFTKNMGGYKTAEVDAFVDSCADTVQALTAEKDELNKKLSILADKLVEYRRDEDSIRSALLSAQRMGDAVVRDANAEAERIVAEAKTNAEKEAAALQSTIRQYEAELDRLKKEISDFKANMLSLYKEHLALLKTIPDIKAEPAPVAEPVKIVEEAPAVAVVPAAPVAPVAPAPVEEAPRASKFANLKFGEEYNLSDDEDNE